MNYCLVRLIRGPVLSGYVGRGKIGWPSKVAIRLHFRRPLSPHSHIANSLIWIKASSLWAANIEHGGVGGSLALAGNELLWAKFFAKTCECLRESCLSNDSGQ
jgi:hypothetical protein